MFRPWLRAAKPDDWTGILAQMLVSVISLLLLLVVLLGSFPTRWVEYGGAEAFFIRAGFACALLYLIGWFQVIAFALLPRSPVLMGRTLRIRRRGKRVGIAVATIDAVRIELRPPPLGEVFVVTMRDGAAHDLCPVRWKGAARVYAGLRARIRRRNRVAARRARRNASSAAGAAVNAEPEGRHDHEK